MPGTRRGSEAAPAVEPPLPHFEDYTGKMARLPAEDLAELTVVARRLERARQGARAVGDKQPRITENTLIRLGVRMVLQRSEQLSGSTEEQLWESLDG